jgi:hypothetical protein
MYMCTYCQDIKGTSIQRTESSQLTVNFAKTKEKIKKFTIIALNMSFGWEAKISGVQVPGLE